MKYPVVSIEPDPALTYSETAAYLKIDNIEERSRITALIQRATEDTQDQLAMSLMPQTLVATYYDDEDICIKRGPILEITSVKDDNDSDVSYTLRTYGYSEYLNLTSSATYPVTVTYRAGYEVLPEKYKAMIMALVGTYYQYPTTATTEGVKLSPHIETWYRRNSREVGIG